MPKLKVKLTKDAGYAPVYSNGAIGGMNVKREIVMHFYTEVLELPKSQTFELENDRIKGEIVKERHPGIEVGVINVERIITTGVIMSQQEAFQLYTWLGKQLKVKEKEGSDDSTNG